MLSLEGGLKELTRLYPPGWGAQGEIRGFFYSILHNHFLAISLQKV